jgi:hypothetical protein
LKRVIEEMPDARALNSFRSEPENKRGLVECHFESVPDVPLLARILIGEVVHALAGALDNLVYQLSLSHQIEIGNPHAISICEASKTYFPIYLESNKDSLESIKKKIKLVADEPAALIKGMQPYQGHANGIAIEPKNHPLWVLYRLDVIDKHRVVLATSRLVALKSLTISGPDDTEPEVFDYSDQLRWQHFKEGAKLFELVLPDGEALHPEVHFHAQCANRVQLRETGLEEADQLPVVALLEVLISYVSNTVVLRLAPFVRAHD